MLGQTGSLSAMLFSAVLLWYISRQDHRFGGWRRQHIDLNLSSHNSCSAKARADRRVFLAYPCRVQARWRSHISTTITSFGYLHVPFYDNRFSYTSILSDLVQMCHAIAMHVFNAQIHDLRLLQVC